MSRRIFIYGLKDPRDGRIKYVGQTANMASRMCGHTSSAFSGKTKRDAWLRELNVAGLFAQPVVLETCIENRANAREEVWIEKMKEQGELFNGPPTTYRRSILPKKSEIIAVTITRPKKDTIEAAARKKGTTLTRFCEESSYNAACNALGITPNPLA